MPYPLSFSNFGEFAGTVSAETPLVFSKTSQHLFITNDSVGNDLLFKFSVEADYVTLKGGESLSMTFATKTLFLNAIGNPVDYRVWVVSL